MLGDDGNQLFEGVVRRPNRRALEGAVRQIRLQRLDEPAFVLGGEILLDRGRPGARGPDDLRARRRSCPRTEVAPGDRGRDVQNGGKRRPRTGSRWKERKSRRTRGI